MPKFSIILATRDRPELFRAALDSVLMQDFDDFEIVVVNDGSSDENLARYDVLLTTAAAALGERLKAHVLVRRPNGHGQSYSLNFGVSRATGEYVAFLDDDDVWTDQHHLSRAFTSLSNRCVDDAPVELYMCNQRAFVGEEQVDGPVWLEGLEELLISRGIPSRPDGSYRVSIDDLVNCNGFCHLNCLIVKRGLYERIGGMDEGIRWECDHDLFSRLIDAGRCLIFHPAFVSRHNVPDPKKNASMTTSLSMVQRRLYQLRMLDKAVLFSESGLIRKRARKHKAYVLEKIARDLLAAEQWRSALHYAGQAVGIRPRPSLLTLSLRCIAQCIRRG